MVILGISIGTRTSGIAIVNNHGLVAFNTVSFKNTWSEKKADYIIRKYERYIKKHAVTVVVLKIPRISHHTQAIKTLLKNISELFTYHGCMVEYKTQEQIKTAVPEIKNREALMNHTATLYPLLQRHLLKELANRNKYHDKMFEAVLVAHLCQQEHRYPPD